MVIIKSNRDCMERLTAACNSGRGSRERCATPTFFEKNMNPEIYNDNNREQANETSKEASRNLLEESSSLQQADAKNPHSKGKVLVVLSSADKLDLANGKEHSTGFYLNELGVPLKAMVDAGYEPVFSNPLGNKPAMDRSSVDKQYFSGSELELKTIKNFVESQKGLNSPLTLKSVADGNLDQFKAVFVPGGHAPMQDLWKDKSLGKILNYFHDKQKPTALICHGPIALLSALDKPEDVVQNGRASTHPWAYNGYKMTVFSTPEEQSVEPKGAYAALEGPVKFYPQAALKSAGGDIEVAPAFQSEVVKDRELITGQNPYSDAEFAKVLLETLDNAEKNIHSVFRDVNAKPEEVWKEIGKFDSLPWHPAIESGKVETDANGSTVRTLVAKGGSPVFVEQLLEQGPNFLRYKMHSGLPLQPEGTLRVEPNSHGGSRITWEAKIEGSDQQTVEAVTGGVMNFYAAGLDKLQAKFK